MVGRQSTAGYLPQQSQVPIYTPGLSETMGVKCLVQGHTYRSEKIPARAGFEPGSVEPEPNALSISPRRLPALTIMTEKPFGDLASLRRTAAFVRETGITL